MPLFWQVVATNFAVFFAGTLTLVLAPVTVSAQPEIAEAAVLAIGLVVIVAVNALLLRSVLHPLDQLTATMREVSDLRTSGPRLREPDHGPVAALVQGFNEMIDRLEAERSTTTAMALAAQESERRRIARELHDQIGQSLTVVLLGLEQAQHRTTDARTRREVQSLQETTRQALEEVRRISQRLRPGVLEDLGLLNSLASLAGEFTETTGVPVTRGFGPGLPALDAQSELVVYRVAQEALTNVARHARADAVEVGVSRQGPALVLRVADNGVGRVRGAGERDGAGIQGMRERAKLVGGSLDVRRRPGGGTELLLVVPVDTPS